LDSVGLRPISDLVEEGTPDTGWAEREMYWIAYFRDRGCDLTNSTAGGEGTLGWMPTDADRERRSQVAYRQWANPEHKDRIAKASGENWKTNREFMIERIKQGKARPEEKQRQSLAKRGSNHHNVCVSENDVLALRRDFADHRSAIAKGEQSPYESAELFYKEWGSLLGVSPRQIAKIANGRAWKHLLPQALATNES
jgi:hypothetical protein